MSEEMMIAGHMLKILVIACVFFGLSCILMGYTIHDKWKARKIRKEEEAMRDEWMEENAARFNSSWEADLKDSELPW